MRQWNIHSICIDWTIRGWEVGQRAIDYLNFLRCWEQSPTFDAVMKPTRQIHCKFDKRSVVESHSLATINRVSIKPHPIYLIIIQYSSIQWTSPKKSCWFSCSPSCSQLPTATPNASSKNVPTSTTPAAATRSVGRFSMGAWIMAATTKMPTASIGTAWPSVLLPRETPWLTM